jgi:glycosyltransferase involved in cell wall biosynthesis
MAAIRKAVPVTARGMAASQRSRRRDRLRVLHAGTLDSVYLASWIQLTAQLGHVPLVAGHLHRGLTRAPVRLPAEGIHRSWQLPWASARGARITGRPLHRWLASLPNSLFEVPVWAAWLRRLASRLQADVVHAHWLPTWGAAGALGGTRPLVVGAMGSDVYRLDRAERWLADTALARAQAIVAPSPHATAVLAARSGRPGCCLHLEPGIDLDAFRPPRAGERATARRALGLAEGPVVLSFRGAAPVYDLPLVIEAFRRLRRRRHDAQLVVVHGRLPLDRAAKAALGKLGGVARVLGVVPHWRMRTCFHAADVGVSVPRSDGSPVSVWECLACATPAVCSALPQLTGRVGERGGVAFVRRTPDEIAGALDAVLADPPGARALGLAGREWCEANVDQRHSLPRVDRLYRHVASAGATHYSQAMR